jgi:mRNA-degrading endonuclease RelE of RelBE toxin-antitoxin system
VWEITFDEDWEKYWEQLPREQHQRITKKLLELKEEKKFRHLKLGKPHFVIEIGQYRVCFTEDGNTRRLMFVGDHKEYEKWLGIR